MGHSLTKILIHAVWSTKERQPFLRGELKNKVCHTVQSKLFELSCHCIALNATSDHIHTFFHLPANHPLGHVLKMIKGGTSHWINQNNFLAQKFAWQVGYGAFSVGASQVGRVVDYIRNQEEHHREMSYLEEVERFFKWYGLKTDESVLHK